MQQDAVFFSSEKACGQIKNHLGATLPVVDSPTSIHPIIHIPAAGEEMAANAHDSLQFAADFAHGDYLVDSRYSQPPLPLLNNNNNLIEVEGRGDNPVAIFSPCRKYRYQLWRNIQPNLDAACIPVCFIMLNPSTADEVQDDPTIRRCIRFAQAWGGNRLVVANIFAYRATAPADMKRQDDPVGPENRKWVEDAVMRVMAGGGMIVVAWGGHGSHRGQDKAVKRWLRALGAPVYCLGLTEGRTIQPRHPLFVPKLSSPVPFKLQ